MQLASKMRFVSAQFERAARGRPVAAQRPHANAMAARLAAAVQGHPRRRGSRGRCRPTRSSPSCRRDVTDRLQKRFRFYDWNEATGEVRWMCAFDTTEADVDAFAAALAEEMDSSA